MIADLDTSSEEPRAAEWSQRVTATVTILGWLALAGLIASSYMGRSSSPYGVCYAASGRSVPCAALPRR